MVFYRSGWCSVLVDGYCVSCWCLCFKSSGFKSSGGSGVSRVSGFICVRFEVCGVLV